MSEDKHAGWCAAPLGLGPCACDYVEAARQRGAVEISQWISVDDRLPDDGGYVLVSDGEDVYMGFKDDSFDGHFMNVESGSMICFGDITHWQPMPAPSPKD